MGESTKWVDWMQRREKSRVKLKSGGDGVEDAGT